jgi:hypothetical protein
MSAEPIARVIHDFRRGNVRRPPPGNIGIGPTFDHQRSVYLVGTATVIDATAMYRDLLANRKSIDVCNDHTVRPPFEDAAICYVNEHGNVVVMHCSTITGDQLPVEQRWDSLADTHTIDWDEVRWVTACRYFAGGRGGDGRPYPTIGPVFQTAWAINADGKLLDLLWTAIARTEWDMATLVALRTVTFLNCRNVVVRQPARHRSIARRVARTGVTVNEIHVATVGSWTRSQRTGGPVEGATPLTTVRGHLARYGVDGRGLLFGKYSGTFWIPAHARGRREDGRSLASYVIDDEVSA